MGASRTVIAPAARQHTSVRLAPKQERRIVSLAARQGISTSEVILRSLDVYEQQTGEQQTGQPEELVRQMRTVLDCSLASLREARHSLDESNRLILQYREHPELLENQGE